MHYHAWLRSGRVFTMATRSFNDRTVAHKWAVKQREDKADRFVLGCSGCPDARPSKRPRPRWGAIARDVAAALGVSAPAARQALTAARAADRRRAPPRTGRTVVPGVFPRPH